MTVSIIIPVKAWQRNLQECVNRCLELDFSDFEILILPDSEGTAIQGLSPHRGLSPHILSEVIQGTVPIRVVPTGPVSPARKRDIALNYAQGEILAFIDDDAYPREDWLKNALKHFADSQIAAVGGPAVTPESDSLRQKVSGKIYANFLVSGKFVYRYLPTKMREVDDYPSCNFLVHKSIMQELGGFNTNFWPGEDSKLCLDITKKLKKKIVYAPDVLVYHRRRPIFLAHIKQIASYALHRGYFVKRYPQTSLRPAYFLPSIFLSGLLLGGIISLFTVSLRTAYLWSLVLYFFVVFAFSLSKNLYLAPLVFLGIILTHFTYGVYFFKGLLSRHLRDEE